MADRPTFRNALADGLAGDNEVVTDPSTIEHFSQSNPSGPGQGNVAALLHRVAASIEDLGEVEVQDIAFHTELDDDGGSWPYMTVYFHQAEN